MHDSNSHHLSMIALLRFVALDESQSRKETVIRCKWLKLLVKLTTNGYLLYNLGQLIILNCNSKSKCFILPYHGTWNIKSSLSICCCSLGIVKIVWFSDSFFYIFFNMIRHCLYLDKRGCLPPNCSLVTLIWDTHSTVKVIFNLRHWMINILILLQIKTSLTKNWVIKAFPDPTNAHIN